MHAFLRGIRSFVIGLQLTMAASVAVCEPDSWDLLPTAPLAEKKGKKQSEKAGKEDPPVLVAQYNHVSGNDGEHQKRLSDFKSTERRWRGSLLRLGKDWFLGEYNREVWVWRVGDEEARRLKRWATSARSTGPELLPLSVPFSEGTFVVTGEERRHGDPIGPRKLVWWSSKKADFVADLDINSLWVKHIIPLDDSWALICGSHHDFLTGKEVATNAAIIELKNDTLRHASAHPVALRMALESANIRGPVFGAGWVTPGHLSFEVLDKDVARFLESNPVAARNIVEKNWRSYSATDSREMRELLQSMKVPYALPGERKSSPITYNAMRCEWETSTPLPEVVNPETPAVVTPHWLPDGRLVVRQARWTLKKAPGSMSRIERKLKQPYLWNPSSSHWDPIEAPAAPLTPESALFNIWPGDPLVNSYRFRDTVEELDPQSLTWRPLPLPNPRRFWSNFGEDEAVRITPLSDQSLLVAAKNSQLGRLEQNASLDDQRPVYGVDEAIQRKDGGFLLVGWGEKRQLTYDHSNEFISDNRFQWYPNGTALPVILPLPPMPMDSPEILALNDGSFLFFAPYPPECRASDGCPEGVVPNPSLRLYPDEKRWEILHELSVLPARAGRYQARADRGALVRANGDVVWLALEGRAPLPVRTYLKRWRADTRKIETMSKMNRGRKEVSLAEIASFPDGRRMLAALGGAAQPELIALETNCFSCEESFLSLGEFVDAKSTEIFDDSSLNARWRIGPRLPGVVFRSGTLENGRVFALMSVGDAGKETYRAVVLDKALTEIVEAPPLPASDDFSNSRQITVIGDQIFLLTERQNRNSVRYWKIGRQSWSGLNAWFMDETGAVGVLSNGEGQLRLVGRREFAFTRVPNAE